MMNKLVTNAEKQHRALKLRIYPTNQQEILINKTFGCCRQIYNNRLFEKNQFYDTVIRPVEDKAKQKELWKTAHFSSEKEMKEKFPYMKEVSSQALAELALADCGAFDEAENLTGNGQNVFTHKYVKG